MRVSNLLEIRIRECYRQQVSFNCIAGTFLAFLLAVFNVLSIIF